MKKEEEQFLRVYKRTLDPGEAFLAAGFLPEKGETPEEAGKKKLRKFRSKLRTLEKREEKLDEPSLERIKAEIARIAFNDIGRYLRCTASRRARSTPVRSARSQSERAERSR